MLGSEAKCFVKRLGDFLTAKWERPYSVVMGWVRACLYFAILLATLLCVHGSRTKWRSLGISDSASLPAIAVDYSFCVFVLVCILCFLYVVCMFYGVTLSFFLNGK